MNVRTVLFDLDGTLTRSETGIIRSAQYAAEKMGVKAPEGYDWKRFIGPPLHASFRDELGMTDDQAEEATRFYRERFREKGWQENEVYPGIPAVLRTLHQAGLKLVMVTSKPTVFSRRIAERFQMMPLLEEIIGTDFTDRDADKAALIREAIRRFGGPAVMVGDRCFDMEGARTVGIPGIGVCYGYGSRQELEESGASAVAEEPRDLLSILLPETAPARGLFVTIEGMDGCGKSTQHAALQAHFLQLGWEMTNTREPGGDSVAEKIREIILDPANTAMTDETEAFLYAAARAQNVRAVVEPALKAGRLVLSDRYVDSSIAYQGGGRQMGTERIARINEEAVAGRMPDLTVYLRMDPEKALARRLSVSEPDRLEREKEAFFDRTFAAFEELYAGAAADRVVVVDAGRSIPEVTQEMLEKVDRRLAVLMTRV